MLITPRAVLQRNRRCFTPAAATKRTAQVSQDVYPTYRDTAIRQHRQGRWITYQCYGHHSARQSRLMITSISHLTYSQLKGTGIIQSNYHQKHQRRAISSSSENRGKELVSLIKNSDDASGVAAESLLAAGDIDLATVDQFGSTALILAAGKGELDLCRKLLEMMKSKAGDGLDINAQNYFGSTALHCASANGHVEVVRLLLSHEADVHTASRCGSTALTKAAAYGRIGVCRVLLQHQADVNRQNKLGKSALDLAADDPQLLKLLREHLNSEGRGAL